MNPTSQQGKGDPVRRLLWLAGLIYGLGVLGTLGLGIFMPRSPTVAGVLNLTVMGLRSLGLVFLILTPFSRLGLQAVSLGLSGVALLALLYPFSASGVPGVLAVLACSAGFWLRRGSKGWLAAAPYLLLFGGGIIRTIMEFFAPQWTMLSTWATLGLVATYLIFVRRGGLVLRRGLLLTVIILLALLALGLRFYSLIPPDQQFNLQLILVLLVFIIGAILVAAFFTLIFVSAFDNLERNPLLAFLYFIQVLAFPGAILVLLWNEHPLWTRFGDYSLMASISVALDLTLLLGIGILAGLRLVGGKVGTSLLPSLVAWKFLRSQRLVRTGHARAILRVREMVPSGQDEVNPGSRWWNSWDLLAAAVVLLASPGLVLLALVSGWGLMISPLVVEYASWGLAAASLYLLGRALIPIRPRLAGTLIFSILAVAGLLSSILVRPDFETGKVPFAYAPQIPALVVIILSALVVLHQGFRLGLAWFRARSRLPASIRPELAPCLDSRLRQGVGLSIFFSIVGVAVGVWALIVVLSVMKGFSHDLTSKIVNSKDHVVVRATDDLLGIPKPYDLAAQLAALPEVRSASPCVEASIMLASSSNIGVNITLRGILPSVYAGGDLTGIMVSGSVEHLLRPELLVPPDYLRMEQGWGGGEDLEEGATDQSDGAEDQAGAGLIPMPPLPGTEPLASPPPPGAEPIPMPPLPGVDESAIPMTPLPGVSSPESLYAAVLPPVIIGVELAGSLGVGVGGRVELIAPEGEAGPAGLQPKARSFRVAGLFKTGLFDFDMKLAFVSLWEAQRFLGLDGAVNRVEARLWDLETSREVLDKVAAWVDPSLAQLDDWKQMNRNLFSALELEWVVMFVVLGFVVLIASFSILSSLLMIIRQRAGAIAILRTMGMRRREMRRIFLLLGGLIGLMGSLSGLVMGLCSCYLLKHIGLGLPREYYIRELPVFIEPWAVTVIVLASWLLTILASLYPARHAARTDLLEGLYNGR